MKIDSLTKLEEKNKWLLEYDGWHFEGTIIEIINDLLCYEHEKTKLQVGKDREIKLYIEEFCNNCPHRRSCEDLEGDLIDTEVMKCIVVSKEKVII